MDTNPTRRGPYAALARVKHKLARIQEKATELASSAARHQAKAVLLVGTEKHTRQPVTTGYFGSGENLRYVSELLYDDVELAEEKPGLKSWQASGWLRRHAERADLLVADLPWPYQKALRRARFIEVPTWVQQKLPLAGSWDGVLARFRKNTKSTDLRKIRKYQLDYRTTSEPSEVERFYDWMYLPYIQRRFGDLADIEPRGRIVYCGSTGTLLQVVRDHQVVAAVVLLEWEKCLNFLWVGVPEGLSAEMSEGAFSALYYYSIRYGHERGCHEIDLSGTRPLLNDGVFRYKRKWGASVHDGWSRDALSLRPQRFTPGVCSFLANHPWIVRQGDGLSGKVVFQQGALSVEAVDRCVETYSCAGLVSLQLFSFDGVDDQARRWVADHPDHPVKLIDLSQTADPVQAFCRG
jgi:hypothetical protein